MSERKDYYKVLGVPKTADIKEIKKAYRKLAMEWHPDKHSGEHKAEAEKKFREMAEAYEILHNEEKRGRYDRGEDIEAQFQQQNPGGGFPFFFQNPGGGGFSFHFRT